ncbi:transcriptional regulator FilR1 domain-containing protein [Methanolobus sp. ZRKC5]|uniref:transcriptional regulator FilR1 domain-containing protein n=1 Tax=unclassified Methanolobus TaxID=2629569 RepID=UPI00313D755C
MYDESKSALGLENVKIYTYEKDVEISSLTVCDTGFLLRLLSKDNEFSNKQVTCSSPEGRKWGKDLYDYYLKDAKLITEI